LFFWLLQKYRLGKIQQVETCSDNKQGELLFNSNRMLGSFLIRHNLELLIHVADYIEIQNSDGQCSREISVGNQNQTTE